MIGFPDKFAIIPPVRNILIFRSETELMMGIGFPELMIILVIIMIIFGAGKLPEIGAAFGNSIKNFKKSMKSDEETKSEETKSEETKSEETKSEETKPEENTTASLENPESVEAVPESADAKQGTGEAVSQEKSS